MKKILLAALAVLLVPAIAKAQSQPGKYPGLSMVANNTMPVCATGSGCFRFNSGNGLIESSLTGAAYDALITAASTSTLTNKTITSPVFSGTSSGTYTLGGTLTISAPIFSGTATGTYTLGGTPTIASPTITGTMSAYAWNGTASGSLMKPQRIANNSGTPAIAVGAAAQLGTGPSAAMLGGDVGGNLTITTGTTPSAFSAATAATVGTITWNTTFSVAPKGVPLHPCNTNAAGRMGDVAAYVDIATCTTTQCTVKMIGATTAATPTLAASTAYQYCYVVIQ